MVPFAVFAKLLPGNGQEGWSSLEVNVWILLTHVSRFLFNASSAKTGFCESQGLQQLSKEEAEGCTGVWWEGLPQALRLHTLPSSAPTPPHSGRAWGEKYTRKEDMKGNGAGPSPGQSGQSALPDWLLVRDGGLAGRRSVLSRFFSSSLFCSSSFSCFINRQSEGCRVELGGLLLGKSFDRKTSLGNGQPWF